MISREKVVSKITNYIKKNVPLNSDTEEIVRYGLDVTYMNVSKIFILIIIGMIMNCLPFVFLSIFSFGTIRFYASGFHSRNSIVCFISSFIIIFGNVYISLFLTYTPLIKTLIFSLLIIIYYLYAPADTEEKPLINKEKRTSLRNSSLLIISILFLLSFIFGEIAGYIIINSLIIEGVLICPVTYKLFNRRYKNYDH